MKSTARVLIGALSVFVALATFAKPASAVITVYDLRVDFSNSNNPNSTWQYLKGNSLLTHFTPVTQPNLPAAAANGYWGDTASSGNSALMKTTANGSATGMWSNADFLVDEVLVRTTDPNTGAPMRVTWTAPSNGSFTYSGFFWNANAPLGPIANSYAMSLNNGPNMESGTALPGQNRTNVVGMVNGLTPVNVLAGDILALQFNSSLAPPSGALSGISLTIDFTPVPEPSSLVLAALGILGLAGLVRRPR